LVLVWSAAVLCSAALVSRLVFRFGQSALQRKGKTKAAEQNTAALHTKTKTDKPDRKVR
jgi:hypothetical protein